MPTIIAAIITAAATVAVGLFAAYARGTRQEVRQVHAKVQTRNGETLGEIMEHVYRRLRTVEESVQSLEDGQDDILEGLAFVVMDFLRHERRGDNPPIRRSP